MDVSYSKNAALLSLLALGATGAAQAQTLSLSPSAQVGLLGGTYTYTAFLSGSTDAGGYDINVILPAQVSYVAGSGSYLDPQGYFPLPFVTPPTSAGDDLTFSAGFGNGGNTSAEDALFSFSVMAVSALPTAGAQITFGPDGADASGVTGGSAVNPESSPSTDELLTASQLQGAALFPAASSAVPEASPFALLGLGLLPLGLRAARRRAARRRA